MPKIVPTALDVVCSSVLIAIRSSAAEIAVAIAVPIRRPMMWFEFGANSVATPANAAMTREANKTRIAILR